MTFHLPDLTGLALVYLLVFSRAGAMIMLLPAIGDAGVPARVRLVLALAITVALAPVVAHFYPAATPQNAVQLTMLVVREVTAGLLIGAMAKIIMSALQVAGSLIATQTGMAYSQTVDPNFGGQDASIGNFIMLLGTVLIFATNLHHLAIGAIVGSYHLIPPGAPLPTADMAQLAIMLVSGAFALGLQLAAPFIVFAFAVSVGIGFLAKMMPQMQVFFIAMPINLLAGFFLLLLLIGSMLTVFLNFFSAQMAHFIG